MSGNIFEQLKKPVASDADQIDAEILPCFSLVHAYAKQIEQVTKDFAQIKRHIERLQKQRRRISRGSH